MPLAKSTVILVDDGIASGSTIRAALHVLELAEVGRKVLAVPVAPQQIVQSLTSLRKAGSPVSGAVTGRGMRWGM